MIKDCFSCSQSMSTDEDELFCVLKQETVEENDVCEDYN